MASTTSSVTVTKQKSNNTYQPTPKELEKQMKELEKEIPVFELTQETPVTSDLDELGKASFVKAIKSILKRLDSLHILPDENLIKLQETLSSLILAEPNGNSNNHDTTEVKALIVDLLKRKIIDSTSYHNLYLFALTYDKFKDLTNLQRALETVIKLIETKTGQLKKILDTVNLALNSKGGILETTTSTLITTASEALTAVPDASLDALKRRLGHLADKVAERKEISPEYRQDIAALLDTVVTDAKKILKETTESTLKTLKAFSEKLKGTEAINAEELKTVIEIVNNNWKDQLGAVGKIVDNLFTMLRRFGQDHISELSNNKTVKKISAEEALLQGVTIDDAALPNIDQLLNAEKDALVGNTYKMITISIVLESICGITTLTQNDKQAILQAQDFGVALFAKIDANSQIPSWIAKFSYYLLKPILGFYVYETIENGFDFVENKFEQARQNKFAPAISLGVDYFTVINNAFKAVSEKGGNTSIMQLLEQELMGAEYNGGMTPEQLYAAVTSRIVDEFAPKWNTSGTINGFLSNLRISDDSCVSFLNIPITMLEKPVEFIVWASLLIPQFLVNTILTAIVKKILISRNDIGKLFENQAANPALTGLLEEIENLKFSIIELGIEKMQNVWLRIKDKHEEIENAAKKLDITTGELLKSLIANGIDALDASKNKSLQRLRTHFTTSESSRILKQLQDLGLSWVQNELIKEFAAITDELLQKQKMDTTLYQALQKVNTQLFTTFGKQYSPDEKTAVQDTMLGLSTAIGERAVEQAFISGPYRTKIQAKAFVDDLRKKSKDFAQKMQQLKTAGKFQEMESLWMEFKKARLNILNKEKAIVASGPVYPKFEELSLQLATLLNKSEGHFNAQSQTLDAEIQAISDWADKVAYIQVDGHSKLDFKATMKAILNRIDPNLTNQVSNTQTEELKEFLKLPYNQHALMRQAMLAFIRA